MYIFIVSNDKNNFISKMDSSNSENIKSVMKNFTTEELKIILTEVAKEISERTVKNATSIIKEWADLSKTRSIKYNFSSINKYSELCTLTIKEGSIKKIFKLKDVLVTKPELKCLVSYKALNECSFFNKFQEFKYNPEKYETVNNYIKICIREKLTAIENIHGIANKAIEAIYLFEYLTHPKCFDFFNDYANFYKITLFKLEEFQSEFKKEELKHLKNRFEIVSFKIRSFETLLD
jgi:hypothetical protein